MKKGNMLIAQSGGPSMVINQSLVGAVLAARRSGSGVGKIYGALHGIRGILDGAFIDLRKETTATLEAVAATPSSALGSVRHKPSAEDCLAVFRRLRQRDIRYFFYIGGNDSAETVHILHEEAVKNECDIRCFHIPKTIDNDLCGNDHTPGYGSAARFVACAVKGDDLDNRALGGVKIDVIMGRNAGFLTAAAALARTEEDDGPHLIYLPERPFSVTRFVRDIKAAMRDYGRCVVAVSEGITDRRGTPLVAAFTREKDSHGNVQLSGTGALGDLLANVVKTRTGITRVRADTFGYLQRSFPGVVSPTDALEARKVGEEAVLAAVGKNMASGSIAIRRKPGKRYGVRFEVVPLHCVAKVTRRMPDAFISPEGNYVTQAFLEYARPLVGALPPCARFSQLRRCGGGPTPGKRKKA
ncbi:MAG TPA: 6-phosphofructokinase [Kiritimatiellia bacterium]|jgi:6-phosphofructokinase 1|nr:6-phosphofructokinase [Kiritimatiellia bacterium]HOR97360.1 6-phosphofructokinase [Kiritimatiellia bacterium]HPK37510.1 6-phosphofructokinase [Kiritimatiellia bacterium]HPW74401.1 6-phosphofructokinase [Kiritimatiellia bacterium]